MTEILFYPVFWLMIFFLLTQMVIYLFLFRRLAALKVLEATEAVLPPVSVIIAARNEEENLAQNLPLIFGQNYPDFEVIVVDDQSEDETPHLLEAMAKGEPRLRVVSIKEQIKEFAGKKLALTLAVKAAKNDILLLTDADCRPASEDWIKHIASAYYGAREREIVLGFSPYEAGPGFLNLFIRFDTFYTAIQYFSFAIAGNPYMGIGRNLSYRRTLFFKNKGFAPFLKIISGDDDLFVNRAATNTNTGVALHPDSFVYSTPKSSWGSWLRQKKRHMQVGKLYRKGHKSLLGMIWLSSFLFYASIIAGFFLVKPFWVAAAVFGLRLVMQIGISWSAMKKLRLMPLLPFSPLLDILYQMLYLPLMGMVGFFSKTRKIW